MAPDPTSTNSIPNVVLIGLRGSGKSSVGSILAKNLGRAYVDLDDRTCTLLDATSVAEAWQLRGVAAFRLAETTALRTVLTQPGQIIALGGGTPTAPGAAELIRMSSQARTAAVFYLRAPADTLRERLAAADPALRPPLTGSDPLAEIEVVLARRDPLYLSLADHIIEVRTLTPGQVAEQVASLITPARS